MQRWILLATILPSAVFPLAALFIGLRNPSIFSAPSLLVHAPYAAILFFLAICTGLIYLHRSTQLREKSCGLILFFLFSIGYFLTASILNKPDINTNNIYFAADSSSWYQRMAAENGGGVGTRAVHPYAYIIFRPMLALLSILTGGDRFHANLILLALAGGGCVFLMWKIVQQISRDQTYAVLFASLLGLSFSHLIFASVIESYIFSTFWLLLFIWLLLNNKPASFLIATSIVTLGITVTNIAQQLLTALLVQRNLRRVLTIFSIVVLLGIGLNFISRFIYPVTEFFFIPLNFTGEQRFSQELNFKRVGLMAENLFIYNIASPQPYSNMRNQMPHFNFLNGTITEYVWFGWLPLILWVATLGFASFCFFKNPDPHTNNKYLSISMLACLVFNFLLHIGYGIEPFLYSAGWTYALILFAAIALKELAKYTWFNFTLIVLVASVFVNNLWVLYLIARRVSEFLV